MFGKKEKYTFYKEGSRIEFLPFPEKTMAYKGDGIFCFLNQTHRFGGVWDDRALGDLWRYNLNYMDFILQPSMSVAEGVAWIENFIDAINANKIASDPYPISLRGINWIKFISLHWDKLSSDEREKIDTALYSQYKILSKKTERHLLANHYLENGLSLLFAAIYFCDERFWRKAKKIVISQLEEQIMSDGAHFELSPMYHCVILERILDCYNLISSVKCESFDGLELIRNILKEKACQMIEWLDAIVVADDRIPLLNDSANGIALSPKTLREYAETLGIDWGNGQLDACGYRRVLRPNYVALLDMAPLGVSYNLGHAHADTGTFLLWVDDRKLLVDTGTSTYNSGERREYERSTSAHNTVVVHGENSSKVWGAFRCAQRAQVSIESDGPEIYTLIHNGYRDKGIICRRSFVCKEESLEVVDTLQGFSSCEAIAYFHLASDVEILSIEDSRIITDRATFTFEGHQTVQLTHREISEEYNVLQPTLVISVRFSGSLRTCIDDF